jgi:hypothetical protein
MSIRTMSVVGAHTLHHIINFQVITVNNVFVSPAVSVERLEAIGIYNCTERLGMVSEFTAIQE